MTLPADLLLVEKALDALERQELRVLVWGLVDSALSEEEVSEALDQVLATNAATHASATCTIGTAADLRQRLMDQALLFAVPGRPGARPRYRTRMAEGLRLMTRLRQMFPGRHEGRDGWISAPTLVADYRLLWRPRRYPRRDRSQEHALEQIRALVGSAEIIDAVAHWSSKASSTWALAQFQVDAAARILQALDQEVPRGTLVAAGTGSGKTLAFYLPVLSWLAAQKKRNAQAIGVRVLALYPRNELLKDQLLEVFEQSRKFDDYLGRSGAGPVSVGVLFGDTPQTLKAAAEKWSKSGNSAVCPFFRCPSCGGEMLLTPADVTAGIERLVCRGCGSVVDRTTLRLTRRAMQESPPDVLFTSVEMLNQRMADSQLRHLFGLGPHAQRVPSVMLLDEVHVYVGTYGAQVAHLLRRWSALTQRRTSFVGLSATIVEGREFFAALTDMDPSIVEEVSPRHEDMEAEGAEYMVALRGDPVSQTALLSTSIQTLMLMSRLVDRRDQWERGRERPFAGWRAFAFTDQMDATNRLYYDLLDAEGRDKWRRPATRRHPNGGLAHLRIPGPSLRRFEGGQDWRIVRSIGHDLSVRHDVGRTTAYDTGVDNQTQIVVATAALEVGYDDPAVGVILQHKAPRDIAQFLQRKGRAGRTRHTRPWTIMVLSDYGRDRLAYQAYEQFFDPELPRRELPMANRYIRRMQAAYALVDYLGVRMQAGEPVGSVWRDLAVQRFPAYEGWPAQVRRALKDLAAGTDFPLEVQQWNELRQRALRLAPTAAYGKDRWQAVNWIRCHLRRKRLVTLLSQMLKDGDAAERLAQFVCGALNLPREEVDTLLWDHPRPLLLGAIPTALRRLATDWRAHGVAQSDGVGNSPLPEFVPATLFSDLSLPEVRLIRPDAGHAEESRYLPVLQAMSELAPGKVSRRLDDALWLGPDQAALVDILERKGTSGPRGQRFEIDQDLDVDAFYRVDPQTPFFLSTEAGPVQCPAYRPLDILLTASPGRIAGSPIEVLDTSNARLVWRSQIFGRRAGAVFPSPSTRVGVARLVSDATVFTHASQSPATVRRYAVASKAGLRIRRAQERIEQPVLWRFTRNGQPCGIGFEMEVDALCFSLRLPPQPHARLVGAEAVIVRAARAARYAWEAVHGGALAAVEGNPFLRGWLAQIFQVAAVSLAESRQSSLAAAIDAIASGAEAEGLRTVLSTVFQSPEVPDDEEEATGSTQEPRLRAKLLDAVGDPEVLNALHQIALLTLTEPIDADWDEWLAATLKQTLGAALLEAIQQACPQVDVDDLVVDLDPGPREEGRAPSDPELWISEVNPGGNGLIEQVIQALASDSTEFYRRIEAALGPSEFEVIDAQLRDFLRRIGTQPTDDGLVAAAQAIRLAQSSDEAQQHLAGLRRSLVERGHAVFHGYIAALSNRVLRPETPPALDALLAELMQRWDTLEARLGVEVDARVVCAIFSADPRIDLAFADASVELPAMHRETWRFSVLMGVVWARGHALRSNALPLPARFSDLPPVTERLLLADWLTAPEVPVSAADANWMSQLHERLVNQGRATLLLERAALDAVMATLVTTPVQLEYLNVYPRLDALVRSKEEVHLHVELAETV